MGTTRFKGENNSERLSFSEISDSDMIQLRHKPGTEEDSDKGISKASLCSCPFGVSDTSASTAVKSAVLTDSNPDFNLVSGREVVVCFTTANTASSPSLNFAGSGSIPIYYPNGSTVGSWPANTWMHLKYFYATIGNTSIQRWILLSPLPVDTVASNNMHSVTSNAVSRAMSYSTDEVNTGKKWIDGNTIYRKVLIATLQTNEEVLELTVSHQIKSLVSVKGLLSKENTDFVIPYCFIDGSTVFQIYTYCYGANLFIIPRSSDGTYFTAGCVVRAIVEYTKTTD